MLEVAGIIVVMVVYKFVKWIGNDLDKWNVESEINE